MKTRIFETLFGFLTTIFGFASIFIFFNNIYENSPWLFGAGLFMVGFGVIMLFIAGRRDNHIPGFDNKKTQHLGPHTKSILERNNEMISNYHKTLETRDKLRILKRSGKLF